MTSAPVGVLGAASLVGQCLLQQLQSADQRVVAFSQKNLPASNDRVVWRNPGCRQGNKAAESIPYWICAAPIWVLPDHLQMLKHYGAQKIVALSSTSALTKRDSVDTGERETAQQLDAAELALAGWGEQQAVDCVILRPTLIYGLGKDKNIAAAARLIQRLGFFPLLGNANGLRQPIHARDVAKACLQVLASPALQHKTYFISGGETLPYREMIGRVFDALGRPRRMPSLPAAVMRGAIAFSRVLPQARRAWTLGMAERMQRDMIFSHQTAAQDFGFAPGPFVINPGDLPAP